MSTMIALFLVLSTLVGCAGETLVNVKNALPSPEPAPVEFSVELEVYEESVQGEDGVTLAECSYEVPVMRVLLEDGGVLEEAGTPEQEQALAVTDTFNARFSGWQSCAPSLAEDARADQAFRDEANLPPVTYTDDLRCAVYQTEHLVSVSGCYSTYTGGVHPNSILMSWNFDLQTGEFFEPETLDEDTGFRESVRKFLMEEARKKASELDVAPEDFYWADYEDILTDWSSYAVSFDEEGMTVGFSPYELGAYALGPQEFHLTYDQLLPHLGQHGRALLGLDDMGEESKEK